jgi:hypothetical protein
MGRPKSFENLEELEQGIDAYFDKIEKANELAKLNNRELSPTNRLHDKMPTMLALAHSLGVSFQTLNEYSKLEPYSEPIKLAKERIEAMIAEGAGTGRYHSTFSIMNLKANYGWRDGDNEKQSTVIQIVDSTRKLETKND